MLACQRNRNARRIAMRTMLTSAVALAAALSLGGVPAFGQAFLGNATVNSGTVNIDRSTPNLDVVTVGSDQAVVTWTPTDTATGGGLGNPIDFLPAGAQVNYQNSSAVTDYTILNRIVPVDPARPVAFNGTVTSQLTDLLGNSTTGGSVWFYSPGGIIIGDGAVFDIGSLLLTTLDPVVDGLGNFLTGGSFSLQQATTGSIVNVLSDAAINATQEGSYVALVAPVVYQRGTVTVNGSAAYVAAEAADITISNGLFDINVTVGSTDNGFPLQHLGTTTGPASTGAGDNHRIYMVTIPKNDAVTMVFGDTSQLGFDVAGAADVVNNVVVLSAGRNVSDTSFAAAPVNALDADINIDGGTFTSAVTARATADLFAASTTATAQFASDVRLQSDGRAHIGARQSGVTMTIGGNATVIADAVDGIADGADATAGEALIYADNGGTMSIAGSAVVQANAVGGANSSGAGATGSGTGGSASIFADGGTVSIVGDATLAADGSAGTTGSTGIEAGDGTGGSVYVTADNGGAITVAGSISLSAQGYGGENSGGGDGISGTGTGGIANLTPVNGTIDIGGDVSTDVFGSGGFTIDGSGGGIGQGGETNVSAATGMLTIGGDVTARADASGGSVSLSGAGGDATAGAARITVYDVGGSVTINGTSFVSAIATGGIGFGGTGGAGTGGNAVISAAGGPIALGGDVTLDTSGNGGSGMAGGAGTGGTSTIVAQGGSIAGLTPASPVNANVLAGGTGGSGDTGDGGTGTGGLTEVVALNNAVASSIAFDTVNADSTGLGGAGGFGLSDGSDGGRGGDGQGGQTLILASAGNGTLNVGVAIGEAAGIGGAGGLGGDDLSGTGTGGAGGRGGDGYGGNVQIGTESGAASADNDGSGTYAQIIASTDGQGGLGGDGGSGTAQGAGGSGGDGFGGAGGGTVLLVRGSPVTVGDVTLTSNGVGGDGGAGSTQGDGGDGEGGSVSAIVTDRFQSGEPGSLYAGAITGLSLASGGAGATTGAVRYGSVDVQVANSTATIGSVSMQAIGDTAGAAAALPSSISVVNGTLDVAGGLGLQTPGDLALVADGATVQADSVDLLAGGSIVDSIDGTGPSAAGVVRANQINLQAGQDIITGAGLETAGPLYLAVPGVVSTGDLSSDDLIVILADGGISAGNLVSGDEIELYSTAGDVTVGDIVALSDVDLATDSGAVAAGTIVSGDSVTAGSGTTVTIAGISAGLVNPSNDPAARYRVGVDAGTSMTIGAIAAASDIGLLAEAGTITTGLVTTPGSLAALATDGVTLAGASTGTGANNAVYIAEASMADLLGPDFDPTPLFTADPIPVGGPISIGGPVTTGLFVAAGQSFAAQGAISAQSEINILAAGLASFNGVTGAPIISVGSRDIAIGANGTLGTAATGQLTLATDGLSVVLGDAQGTGYVLDGAEAQRLHAGDILVDTTAAGEEGQVVLGDLALTGANGGNANIAGAQGAFTIATANTITVAGDVRFTGMSTSNVLRLSAGDHVDLVTDTGSIGLFGAGSALSGALDIQADNIHVASASLLDRLDQDANFAGRDQALAQVNGAARPEGYLQAGEIRLAASGSLLIQNSNDAGSFGGFTAGAGGMHVVAIGETQPVDVVIYGRLADAAGGFVINNAVRDALTLDGQGQGFSSVSSVNGCLLTAASCDGVAPPQPTEDPVVATIATDVLAIVTGDVVPPAILTDEEAGQAGGERGPIVPPVSLISTGAMQSDELIEEPVTGGGNPSLMSTPAETGSANNGDGE